MLLTVKNRVIDVLKSKGHVIFDNAVIEDDANIEDNVNTRGSENNANTCGSEDNIKIKCFPNYLNYCRDYKVINLFSFDNLYGYSSYGLNDENKCQECYKQYQLNNINNNLYSSQLLNANFTFYIVSVYNYDENNTYYFMLNSFNEGVNQKLIINYLYALSRKYSLLFEYVNPHHNYYQLIIGDLLLINISTNLTKCCIAIYPQNALTFNFTIFEIFNNENVSFIQFINYLFLTLNNNI